MKRIYDYRTGKLYESRQSSKSRKINEAAVCQNVFAAELGSIIMDAIDGGNRPICINGISEERLFEIASENGRCFVIDAAKDKPDLFIDKLFSDAAVVIVANYSTEDDVYGYISDILEAASERCVILLNVSFNEPALASRFMCLNFMEDEIEANESVSSRFAKYRKLYEDEDMSSDDDSSDEEKSDGEEDKADDEGNDEKDDEKKDDDEDDEDDEEVKFDAVVLKVKKDAGEDCKQELIDAGIDEDDIEVVKGEDDDEFDEVKVSVDSISELKDYLDGKGIDLEDKLGIGIVEDSDDEEGEGEEEGDKEEGEGEEGEEEDINFDNFDFDMFGGDETAEADKK